MLRDAAAAPGTRRPASRWQPGGSGRLGTVPLPSPPTRAPACLRPSRTPPRRPSPASPPAPHPGRCTCIPISKLSSVTPHALQPRSATARACRRTPTTPRRRDKHLALAAGGRREPQDGVSSRNGRAGRSGQAHRAAPASNDLCCWRAPAAVWWRRCPGGDRRRARGRGGPRRRLSTKLRRRCTCGPVSSPLCVSPQEEEMTKNEAWNETSPQVGAARWLRRQGLEPRIRGSRGQATPDHLMPGVLVRPVSCGAATCVGPSSAGSCRVRLTAAFPSRYQSGPCRG